MWLVPTLYKTVVQKYFGKEFVLGFFLTFPDNLSTICKTPWDIYFMLHTHNPPADVNVHTFCPTTPILSLQGVFPTSPCQIWTCVDLFGAPLQRDTRASRATPPSLDIKANRKAPVSTNIKHPHILGIPGKSKNHVTVWACAESVCAAEITQRCLDQSTTLTHYSMSKWLSFNT